MALRTHKACNLLKPFTYRLEDNQEGLLVLLTEDKPRSICSRKMSAVTKVFFSSPTGVNIAKIEGRDATRNIE